MKRRKTIIESEKAKIQLVGDAEYCYWVYRITPLIKKKVNGITFVEGGNVLWEGMYKTEKEAFKKYNEIIRG